MGGRNRTHFDIVTGLASVLVVNLLFRGELVFGDDAAFQVGKVFCGNCFRLFDQHDAPGDGIAVVVQCQIKSPQHAGVFPEGQLQVEGDQIELGRGGFAERDVKVLVVVDDARPPLQGAVGTQASYPDGMPVWRRYNQVRFHFQGIGRGGQAVTLVNTCVIADFRYGKPDTFGKGFFNGKGDFRDGRAIVLQLPEHVGQAGEQPFF